MANNFFTKVGDKLAQAGGWVGEKFANLDPTAIRQANPGAVRDAAKSVTDYQNAFAGDLANARARQAPQITAQAPVTAQQVGFNNVGFGDANTQQSMQLLSNAANGMAPSAAQGQLQMGTDAAIATQMALANSARGGLAGQADAQRAAMFNSAALGQQNAAQSGILRAQEMGQARGQFAQTAQQNAGQVFGADAANQAAGINTAQFNSNQGMAGQQFNATLGQQTQVQNAALQQQTEQIKNSFVLQYMNSGLSAQGAQLQAEKDIMLGRQGAITSSNTGRGLMLGKLMDAGGAGVASLAKGGAGGGGGGGTPTVGGPMGTPGVMPA